MISIKRSSITIQVWLLQNYGASWDGFEVPARKMALDAGGTIHSLSGDSLAEMKAAGKVRKRLDQIADVRLDGAMLVKTAKDLIAKYDK